jgi:hypothetical protein
VEYDGGSQNRWRRRKNALRFGLKISVKYEQSKLIILQHLRVRFDRRF